MGRLSYIRHKNKQESSFSANDFVNGIQVSFADSPAPLLLPITALAFVQVSQRSTLRLEVGMTLLSPLALSTRLIRLSKATHDISNSADQDNSNDDEGRICILGSQSE
jgi:hypothetical protein